MPINVDVDPYAGVISLETNKIKKINGISNTDNFMSIKSVVIDTTSCSKKMSILFAFTPQFFLVNLCIETIISKMLCSMVMHN